MILNVNPLRLWFGYTRGERRAAFILLIITILIIAARYTVPESNISIEEITDSLTSDKELFSIIDGDVRFTADTSVKKINTRKWKNRQKIDINRCDSVMLQALPGIGRVLSARIIKYRNLLGGYARVEQLKEVFGLPEITYDQIKTTIIVDTSAITRINVNSADFRTLLRFPYLEKYEVTGILKYRELQGKISGITDLVSNKLISKEKAVKIRPYLLFE